MASNGSEYFYQQAENKRGSVDPGKSLDVALVEAWAWTYISWPARRARARVTWLTCRAEWPWSSESWKSIEPWAESIQNWEQNSRLIRGKGEDIVVFLLGTSLSVNGVGAREVMTNRLDAGKDEAPRACHCNAALILSWEWPTFTTKYMLIRGPAQPERQHQPQQHGQPYRLPASNRQQRQGFRGKSCWFLYSASKRCCGSDKDRH